MLSKKQIAIILSIALASLILTLLNVEVVLSRFQPMEHEPYSSMPYNAKSVFIELRNNNPTLFTQSYVGSLEDIVSNAIVDAQIKLYKLDNKLNSKQDVISYLQEIEGQFPFESHRKSATDYDWEHISKDMRVTSEGVITIYSFRYSNLTPTCEDYELHISSDGYMLDFRYDKQ